MRERLVPHLRLLRERVVEARRDEDPPVRTPPVRNPERAPVDHLLVAHHEQFVVDPGRQPGHGQPNLLDLRAVHGDALRDGGSHRGTSLALPNEESQGFAGSHLHAELCSAVPARALHDRVPGVLRENGSDEQQEDEPGGSHATVL